MLFLYSIIRSHSCFCFASNGQNSSCNILEVTVVYANFQHKSHSQPHI